MPYRTITHRDVPTSHEIARATHIPRWKLTQVVAPRLAGMRVRDFIRVADPIIRHVSSRPVHGH